MSGQFANEHPPAPYALWHCCVLVGAVALFFASVLNGDFVWLDHVEIVEAGYRVTSSDDLAKIWVEPLEVYAERSDGASATTGGYWRPVYALSISLDWWLWGHQPTAFHAVNLVWHLVVVIGLYLLGCLVFARSATTRRAVFLATLAFAIHPLATHSVSWISGRKDLLCAAFLILGLIAWWRVISTRASTRRLVIYLVSVLCLLLSIGSKELGYVMPFLATMLLWWAWPQVANRGRAIVLLLGLYAVLAAMLGWRAYWLSGLGLGDSTYPAATLMGNVLTSVDVLWHYALLVIWPRTMLISDAWPISTSLDFLSVLQVLGAVIVAAMTVLGLYRRQAWAFAMLWALVLIAPVSGVVPLRHFHAERYLYPASWGLLLAVALLATMLIARFRAMQWAGIALSLGFILVACAGTWRSNQLWLEDAKLFASAVDRDPYYVEGLMALAKLNLDLGSYQQSVRFGQRAYRVVQDSPGVRAVYWSPVALHSNLGLALLQLGDLSQAQHHFSAAAKARPGNAVMHYQLGAVALAGQSYSEARDHFLRSIMLRDRDRTRSALATTLMHLGELGQAADLFDSVVERNPDDIVSRNNYASTLLVLRRFEQAEEQFLKLLERSSDAIALAKLAWCQFELGKQAAAGRNLRDAVIRAPDDATVVSIQRLLASRGLDLP